MHVQFQNPAMTRWVSRLARVPRWAWIAFFLGAIIPAVIVIGFLMLGAIGIGLVVMLAVLAVGTAIGLIRRAFRLRAYRKSNQIVVRSVRVIDP
jgi:hypothetical protein